MRGAALILLLLPGVALAQTAAVAPPQTESRPAPKPDAPPSVRLRYPDQAAQGDTKPLLRYSPVAATAPAAQPPQVADAPPIRETLREDDFSFATCLLDLSLIGADFSIEPPVTDPDQRDCGIDRPIMLREPLPGITINGGALMRCETALRLARWLRDSVRPAAAMLPGQPELAGIQPGTTYQCRPTIGDKGVNLSEHAFGNAFDIAAFEFRDGTQFKIAQRQESGDMAEAVQAAIRGAACLSFTTVLGPGSNAAHGEHLHLDIKARRSGWRLCQ